MIDVKILYKYFSLNEKRPKAIPSFQIRLIFKNFDENISDPKILLSRKITYILESLSSKNIEKTSNELIIKLLLKIFFIIKGV